MWATTRHILRTRRRQQRPRCMSISSKRWLIAATSMARRSYLAIRAGIIVTLPKRMTSSAKADGRFGKQDFVYLAGEDVYRCPAGEKLKYRYTTEEHGQTLHRYWTDACGSCPIKVQCTTGRERRITRWEHEAIVEAVEERLDKNPDA